MVSTIFTKIDCEALASLTAAGGFTTTSANAGGSGSGSVTLDSSSKVNGTKSLHGAITTGGVQYDEGMGTKSITFPASNIAVARVVSVIHTCSGGGWDLFRMHLGGTAPDVGWRLTDSTHLQFVWRDGAGVLHTSVESIAFSLDTKYYMEMGLDKSGANRKIRARYSLNGWSSNTALTFPSHANISGPDGNGYYSDISGVNGDGIAYTLLGYYCGLVWDSTFGTPPNIDVYADDLEAWDGEPPSSGISGTGAISGGAGIIAASGTATPPVITGTGAITGGAGTISGFGGGVIVGTGAIAGGAGVIAGAGTFHGTLRYLLDASLLALSEGSLVTTAPDPSGWGNDAAQATGANKPTYRAAGLNGFPSIEFAGSHRLVTPSMFSSAFNTAFSAYIVFKRSGAGSAALFGSASNEIVPTFSGTLPSGSKAVAPGVFSGANLTVSAPNVTPFSATYLQASANDNTCVAAIVYDGAHLYVSVNGIDNEAQTANVAAIATTGNLGLTGALTIGSKADASASFTGQIAYLAVYAGAHARATRMANEKALRQRFNIIPPRVVFTVGDSTTYGTGSSSAPTTGYPAQMAALLDAARPRFVFNVGVGGSTAQQWIDTYLPATVTPFYASDRPAQGNLAVVFVSGNDGITDAARWTLIQTICSTLKTAGWVVVICTLPPRGSTSYTTLTGLIRAGYASVAHAYVDFTANAAFDSVPDAATDTGNATYYADGTHLTDAGYLKLAQMVEPAIDGLVTSSIRRHGRWGFGPLNRVLQ